MKSVFNGRFPRSTAVLLWGKEIVEFGMKHCVPAEGFVVEVVAGFTETDGTLIIYKI